jgi:hypothetical protein
MDLSQNWVCELASQVDTINSHPPKVGMNTCKKKEEEKNKQEKRNVCL